MKTNKRLPRYLASTFITLLLCFCAFAQQTIRGTLRSPSGEPLAGATITVKGTNKSVITDASGSFVIDAAAGSTLVLSSVGFQEKEISASRTNINEVLQITDAALNEVVVIGYQSVKKKDLTGAAAVINQANANRVSAASVGESIQGLAPGVTVRNGGAPGQNSVIEIRGVASFRNSDPLYVIDGMIADANSTINTNDVESIQILKDASAAAIYGSRAANGVVIITTKKGKEGPAKISFSAKYGVQQIPKRWDVMNNTEFAAMQKLQYQNSGVTPPVSVGSQFDPSVNTDWQDAIYRTGNTQDYNLGISGGSKTSTYLISGSYYKNQGVLIGNSFERASLRINSEFKKGRLTVGENLVISNNYGQNPGGGVNAFYEAPQMLPIIAIQGNQYKSIPSNPAGWGMGTNNAPTYASNYVAVNALDKRRYNYAKLVGNVYADFKFTNWLSYRFNAGAEVSFDNNKELRDTGIWRFTNQPPATSTYEDRQRFLSVLFEHTLNFNKVFGLHNINGVIGYSQQEVRRDIISASRTGLQTYGGETFTTIDASLGTPSAGGGTPDLYRIRGYLGRLNYTYNDKYLLTVSGRIDQDSRFGKSYRTGYFPAGAIAWRISKEKFFNVSWISDLKLRASNGKLGINTLGSWEYLGLLNSAPRAIYGQAQTPVTGQYQAQITNPDLRWEKRIEKNVGFDASLFNNKISITAEAYNSLSKDVLLNLPLAFYLGNLGGNPSVNAGSIRNTGVEIAATYRHDNHPFKWDVSINATTIRNKVESVGNQGAGIDYIEPAADVTFIRSQIGHPMDAWYVIQTNGIFQSQAEVNSYTNKNGKIIQPQAKPGDIRYVDENGDGQINNDDRAFVGSPWPTLQTGAQFNASYRQFTLNIQLVGVFGYKIFNDVRRVLDSYQLTNFRTDVDPWSTSNTGGSDPRLAVDIPSDPSVSANNMRQTSRWLENGSYLRLRNIEIGYTFSQNFLTKVDIKSARFYVSGQNLLTLTKYAGLDPDVVGSGILQRGIDAGNWPSSRLISAGIQCEF